MLFKVVSVFLLVLLSVCSGFSVSIARPYVSNSNISSLNSIKLPDSSSGFNVDSSSCIFSDSKMENKSGDRKPVKVNLKRRSTSHETEHKNSVIESASRDLTRIKTLHRRVTENQAAVSKLTGKKLSAKNIKQFEDTHKTESPVSSDSVSGQLMVTLESGVSLGSGEYFMDVFVGTPPQHYSLILDTGSDLNWLQCLPCHDCFEQTGPFYNPKHSTSYKNITCTDQRCKLVTAPDSSKPCVSETQTCPYYYWYGDSSNTTGDFAVETFTVNLTSSSSAEFKRVENVMFGCGHWNRGLFHGAAGLLGLGRGPLSFSSQLKSLYGHSFSYCLVDRNSDSNVTSKLIFGEDKELLNHPNLNFTKLVTEKENSNSVDTFYYVDIESVTVGGEELKIDKEVWGLSQDGSGGTIVDSGTTLSYFAEPAYQIIQKAFVKRVTNYPLVQDFPILHPCYNISGSDENLQLPEFGIRFSDGGMWNFPVENTFIRIDSEEIACLAIMGTPKSGLSIIGNYQQQNFHVLYDTGKSRLGFAPMKCSDI